MADFATALRKLDALERGYANDPRDEGGETWAGIARTKWPAWEGWARIDAVKGRPDFPACLGQDADLHRQVANFYLAHFWPTLYSEIADQDLASELFEAGVNTNMPDAVRSLQRALNRLGFHLADDGIFGPGTLSAISRTNGIELMIEFKVAQLLHYLEIILAKPDQKVFAHSWFRRTVI